MAEIQDVTVDNFDTQVLQAEGLVLIYYYAPWCKPCQEMEETVQAVAEDVAEKMRMVQVNTDREEGIINQQKIRTIPSFQIMSDGKPVALVRGSLSKLELLGKLSEHISAAEEESQEEAREETPAPDTGDKAEETEV